MQFCFTLPWQDLILGRNQQHWKKYLWRQFLSWGKPSAMKWKQARSVCKGPEGPFWWMSNGVTSKADPWKLQNTWYRFLHFGDFMMLKRDFVPKVNWCSIRNTPVMSHVLLNKLAEANDPQLTIGLAHWQILTLTMEQVLWSCDSFPSFLFFFFTL